MVPTVLGSFTDLMSPVNLLAQARKHLEFNSERPIFVNVVILMQAIL